ncbi:hypothetical protein CHISP_2182 [Chitinispirillum alkaliphilum]|nr:hypothetical protein CHISP_2182 [Chitinispirillum alkaliphilum]
MNYGKTHSNTFILPKQILWLCLIFTAFNTNALSMPVSERIDKKFHNLDSSIATLSKNDIIKSTKRDSVTVFLSDFMRNNRMIRRIIITNSQGITTYDIRAGETQANAGRLMSRQNWYQAVSQNKDSYYSTIESDGAENLFWARPLISGTEFAGAMAVQIDMAILFALVENDKPFQINVDNTPFFRTHDWARPSDPVQTPLRIKGFEQVSVITYMDKTQTEQKNEKETTAPAEDKAASADSVEKKTSSDYKQIKDSETQITAEAGETKRKSEIRHLMLILITAFFTTLTILIIRKKTPAKQKRFYYNRPPKPQTPKEYPLKRFSDEDKTKLKELNSQSEKREPYPPQPETKPEETISEESSNHGPDFSLGRNSNCIKTESPEPQKEDQPEAIHSEKEVKSGQENAHAPDVHTEIYKRIHGEMTGWILHEFERMQRQIEQLQSKVEELSKSPPESEG